MDVDDGSYLRGLQVSKLEIAPGHEVVRSELYLDGLRVAADDLAPFELAWDTRGFGDGSHALVARVYVANGGYIDGKTAVWIDNTPPQLGALPASATRGTSFTVPATDNLKLARVEISRGVENEAPVVVTAEPFMFSWPWACGTTAIHVRAFDAAGSEVAADASVLGADPDDGDCDGFRAQSRGGNDCDDDNVSAHPGAMEVPEGYDLDCDGQVASLPRFDFDGDGVPSITDGGSDCNDSDPAIHGPSYSFKHVPITRDGVPVTWTPDDAALDGAGAGWQLYLNSAGTIEEYQAGSGDTPVLRTQLATGANPGSIAEYLEQILAFGSGDQIVALKSDGTGWKPYVTIPAGGRVGKLAFGGNADDSAFAYQIGTELWMALSSQSGWKVERVANVGEPIVRITSVYINQGAVSIDVQTAQSGWSYTRAAAGDPFTRFEATRDSLSLYLYSFPPGQQGRATRISARGDGTGSALYNDDASLLLIRTARPIAAIAPLDDRSVLVTYRDNQAVPQVITFDAGITRGRVTQDAPDLADLVVMPVPYSDRTVFVGHSAVHYLADKVSPAQDPANDGVDRDCDKLD